MLWLQELGQTAGFQVLFMDQVSMSGEEDGPECTVRYDDMDVYYPDLDNLKRAIFGVRFDMADSTAVKIQLYTSRLDGSMGGPDTDSRGP